MSSTFFWVRNFPPTFPARDAGMEQSDNTPPIISERLIVDGTETPVALLADGRLRWSNGVRRCLHVDKEVLGFVTDGVSIKIKTILEAVDGCCHGSRKLVRKDIVFQPLSEESQRLWSQKLREYLDSLGRPKRLFIFLNPFGGKKTAPMVFNDHVKPLLEDAEIQITVQETKHQFHAKEVAHALDIPKYDGIICVSGDGILVEVINGLLERDDWETAVKIPIGVVPAGTGNGVAKSLLDSVGDPCTAVNAALAIIRGHKRSLDVATITQGGTRFFSVLMLAWGLVADVDIESEKYRWMGSARFDFYFSDGYADLIIIKDCPRLPLLSVMSEMSNGRHVKSPYVIYLKVKALFLEPGSRVEEQEKGGIIDVDGEVLARGKGTYQCDRETLMTYDQLQVIVDQGLATLFAPV
ncbi:sphingosine kinase 1-like isoform X5 [Prosopis cineraria]|uniref:sphingosine kinase 1-like isoform X5 n=1 Tax=Prosopis cineraria TaxID=364024 RepID=UPI0024106680|nr:sphingosine kinase 1-like isoform X5 [Prosopis cineraria]